MVWLSSYLMSKPHAEICVEVAQIQLDVARDFFNEQPDKSWLYDLKPWQKVMKDDRVDSRICDQCMAVAMGNNLPVKKRTDATESDQRLLMRLEKLICDGSHEHEQPC